MMFVLMSLLLFFLAAVLVGEGGLGLDVNFVIIFSNPAQCTSHTLSLNILLRSLCSCSNFIYQVL